MSVQIFIENTLKAYHERSSQVSAVILQGQIPSLDQYKYNCGHLQGFREAEQLLAETYKAMFTAQKPKEDGEAIESKVY